MGNATKLVIVVTVLMLAAAWHSAVAAITDYDGKWRLDGTCSASSTAEHSPAITFWSNITVQNGKIADQKDYLTSAGLQAHDMWSGTVQDGTLTLFDQGSNDRSQGWQRKLSGLAASPTEIAFKGEFLQWLSSQWMPTRTCAGTLRLVEPIGVSLAAKSFPRGTVARQEPAAPVNPAAQQATQYALREQAAAMQRAAQQVTAPGARVALVIGNGAYVNADPLRNPANDANAVAGALRQIGFDVVQGMDLGRVALEEKIHDFMRRAIHARVALMFYSGHGMQVDGKNYLIPVDAKLAEASDLLFETVELDKMLDTLSDPGRTTIVLLDACRDNPLARRFVSRVGRTRSLNAPGGLAAYSAIGTGTLIAYATAPGQTALDGQGTDSPFTTSLLKYLTVPGLEIRQLLTRVRADVAAETKNQQIPWDNSSLMGDVYLVK